MLNVSSIQCVVDGDTTLCFHGDNEPILTAPFRPESPTFQVADCVDKRPEQERQTPLLFFEVQKA